MTDFGGAWRGRRVLLTGHTGFKGSWLALWLKELGAEVWGLALAPEGPDPLYARLGLDALVRSRIGDIRDEKAVAAAFADARPDVVFHLAAQPLVLRSYEAPVETFEVNAVGTARVLEAARRAGTAQALVLVATDKVYEGVDEPRPRAEDDALGGHDPYSASKACAEIVAASYRRSFKLPIATARAGNVVGGGDRAENRLVPDLARAFAAGRPAAVRNPASIRPWQHALEPLAGYLTLGARLLAGDASAAASWNFGPAEDSVTVAQVADAAAAAWGAGASWKAAPADGPHEAAALRLDSARARAKLGWAPAWDARRAVSEAIAWYKAAAAPGFDARAFTRRQIADFSATAPAARR